MTAIDSDPALELAIVATGMHLSPKFDTVHEIENDGFRIAHRVDAPLNGDSARDIANAIAAGVMGFGTLFDRWRPDILLLQGDRFEIYAAALAALPFGIPIAHMHGGELTLGAIDDPLRHSMTKIAHLHFVSAEPYARRVRQLGEEDWRITVSGAPSLDNLHSIEIIPGDALRAALSIPGDEPPLIVTFHPATRDYADTEEHIRALLTALPAGVGPVVFTAPNADTGSDAVLNAIERYCRRRKDAVLIANLGTQRYFSLMAIARAMIGNSSSGIVEAASFELPVIDIGDRQKGRIAGPNVVHAAPEAAAIAAAFDRVLDPGFRRSLDGRTNPYGDGHAAARIVDVLRETPVDRRLLNKEFVDR
jgi:UDP-hydrolysing UDP-N-acetyl-D-glucosamine 2-epimerase